jgi:predicted RNase H-like HicB family nuclease
MHNEFTAVFERDGEWVIAYCPEIPGANGQVRSKDDARESLRQAIALILEDRREEGLRAVPADAEQETVVLTWSAARCCCTCGGMAVS